MSKKEARVARKLQKKLESSDKSARLVDALVDESNSKKPRTSKNPASIFSMLVEWSDEYVDMIDSWSWGVDRCCIVDCWDAEIEPKLKEFEKLTWQEIDDFYSGSGHKMHHSHDRKDICAEARSRMTEIEIFDTKVFRFRLGGTRRLWGVRRAALFEIIWYDPTHQIYPTEGS